MATSKDRFALISRFEKLLRSKGIQRTPMNKYAEQWAADGLLQSYDVATIHEIMDYYFTINDNPTWRVFTYRFGDLLFNKQSADKDDIVRMQTRKLMRERLNESGS